MNELLNKFKDWLILNDVRPTPYLYVIRRFLKVIPANQITQENVDNYLLKIIKENKPTYVNSHITTFRKFFKFLKREDITLPKNVKKEKTIHQSLTLEFFEKEIVNEINWFGFKNPLKVKAMLYFMFYTGLRKSEVYLLRRENIDLKNREAKVYLKKTKKEKIMIFPKKIVTVLEEYFDSEPEKKNAFNLGAGGIAYIFQMLKRHFPDIRIYPHLFKKSAITHLYSCDFKVEEISEMVGISVQTILDHYLHIKLSAIKKTYEGRIK